MGLSRPGSTDFIEHFGLDVLAPAVSQFPKLNMQFENANRSSAHVGAQDWQNDVNEEGSLALPSMLRAFIASC